MSFLPTDIYLYLISAYVNVIWIALWLFKIVSNCLINILTHFGDEKKEWTNKSHIYIEYIVHQQVTDTSSAKSLP